LGDKTFFGLGTHMTTELRAEIAQAQALRAGALGAAGVTFTPKSTLSGAPDVDFVYRTSKTQKQVLGKARGLRFVALEERASNFPPNDQRRKAFEKGHEGEYSNSLPGGVPLTSTCFSTQEFQVAVPSIFGVGLTCLIPITSQASKSKAFMADKRVGVYAAT